MVIVAIEGNIGAGKSTLITQLKQRCEGYSIFEEDVNSWMKEGMLELFYNNMKRFAFTFQLRTQISHIEHSKKFTEKNIVERSPFSNKYIFGECLLEDNLLHQQEYTMIDRVNKLIGWEPNMIIVLVCEPEMCMERIKKRNRENENIPNIEYIQHLHKKHIELEKKLKNDYNNIIVKYIDTTHKTPDEITDEALQLINTI